MRLVILKIDRRNAHLANVLDTYMKITLLINVKKHLKRMRNSERNFVSMKEVIVHRKKNPRTLIITIPKRYTHLRHVCLIMAKVLIDISVKVHNRPIGFYIQEQRVI